MKLSILNRFWLAAMALLALAPLASAKEFTLADLQKMVRELEAVASQNSAYKYPIKCNIIKEDETMNAHATIESAKAGEKPQALLEVYTGLIIEANYDPRLIRAVVAHEVAHLAKGHVKLSSFKARDLQHFWVRQIEHEADIYGAELLIKAGYAKKDMIDMLAFLDGRRARKKDWLQRNTSDHATPKLRIAKLADDPFLLKVLVQFDVGLVFMESRRYNLAGEMFEVAAKMEPKLTEAWTNRAQSMLLFYWENLPGALVARTFRPDFGPFILTPESPTKGNEVTEQNRQMYKDAIAAINDAIAKRGTMRDRELLAIAQILHPDNDRSSIQSGIDGLLALRATDVGTKMRIANNLCVGQLLLGDPNKALSILAAECRTNPSVSPAAAENMGRFRVPKGSRSAVELKTIRDILKGWLEQTPRTSGAYNTVYEGYSIACSELNEKPLELAQMPTLLQPAVSIFHKGKELGLLFELSKFESAYGRTQLQFAILEAFPGLTMAVWENGDYAAIFEESKAMRLTSYVPGDSFTIMAEAETVRKNYEVKVGMKVADVAWFDLEGGFKREVIGRKGLETWNMFPGLNFGVLIDKGTIVGITVSDYAPLTREG